DTVSRYNTVVQYGRSMKRIEPTTSGVFVVTAIIYTTAHIASNDTVIQQRRSSQDVNAASAIGAEVGKLRIYYVPTNEASLHYERTIGQLRKDPSAEPN